MSPLGGFDSASEHTFITGSGEKPKRDEHSDQVLSSTAEGYDPSKSMLAKKLGSFLGKR